MALALNKENFLLHKLHSLTGIIPTGFYMCQHLTLNSFSLASPGTNSKFDGVINFFDSIPPHVLLGMEALMIWLPLVFHAVYGMFITSRAEPNYVGTKYNYSQNRMYLFQRISGVFLFLALIVHVTTTTGVKYALALQGKHEEASTSIKWMAWHEKLTGSYHLWLVFYMALVAFASYHLAYGIWNFSIRWGIAVSEKTQLGIQKFAACFFVVITLLGWAALAGFLQTPNTEAASVLAPVHAMIGF